MPAAGNDLAIYRPANNVHNAAMDLLLGISNAQYDHSVMARVATAQRCLVYLIEPFDALVHLRYSTCLKRAVL